MPTDRVRSIPRRNASFTYTLQQPAQGSPIEDPIEYEVIAKYNDDNYNSIGSYPDLPTAMCTMANKILERDSSIKAMYIDKVNMNTLENSGFISVTISG